ncbi:MAG: hypothetical protein IJV58_00195 [Oscillospiraceae bacterium]|nr:hypothetical protein [Oscillospiraceae bacterium]
MPLIHAPLVRGVSRRVIEIPHPQSPCFARAVFYLKPDIPDIPLSSLRREAEGLLADYAKSRRRQIPGVIWFLLGAAASAAVCRVFMGG